MTKTKMSPIPTILPAVIKEYSFKEALDQVLQGKFITRISWDNKEIYGVMINGYLNIHIDDTFKNWIISNEDILATDWITL